MSQSSDGKCDGIVVVTGASSGIGLVTARRLAERGATVAMVCRDLDRGRAAHDQVAGVATGDAPLLFMADLSSQVAIRAVADQIRNRFDHLDVLINNAGGVSIKRELTVDGIETTFATNHLAPFLLSEGLVGLDEERRTSWRSEEASS